MAEACLCLYFKGSLVRVWMGTTLIMWNDPQTLKELTMFTNSTAVCFLNSKYKNPIIPNSSTQSTSGVLLLPPGYNKFVFPASTNR